MKPLPQAWVWSTLGDVADYGKTIKVEPSEIGSEEWVLELEDIEKDTSKLLQRINNSERQSKSTKNRFKKGDVLYGKLRPYLNKVLLADKDGVCTTEIIPLSAPDGIDERYLFYYLKRPDFLEYVTSISHGLNMPRLGTKAGQDALFPLAPLNEQKRIGDKIDALLARVDACRERLDRVPLILKRFRQAVLSAATSGHLTEDWRDSAESLDNWRTVTLAQVAKARLGKMLDKAKNQGEPTPYLRNINVRWFEFDLSNILEIKVSEKEVQELSIRDRDVLVCEGGEPGRCAVWRGVEDTYVYQKALHRVRVGDNLIPEWLCYCLKDATDSGSLANLFTGTTIKHLTGIALAQFEFKLPPVAEQHEIVSRVESLFAFADRLQARYASTRTYVDQLTPSLLAKAFRGELVPQDPNDEPAEKLLERIKGKKSLKQHGKISAGK